MMPIPPKRPRLRLNAESYQTLRLQILERDHWRCQLCGSTQNLEVHHQQLRSQQGSDQESNLITLCSGCHGILHNGGPSN